MWCWRLGSSPARKEQRACVFLLARPWASSVAHLSWQPLAAEGGRLANSSAAPLTPLTDSLSGTMAKEMVMPLSVIWRPGGPVSARALRARGFQRRTAVSPPRMRDTPSPCWWYQGERLSRLNHYPLLVMLWHSVAVIALCRNPSALRDFSQ